MSIAAIHTALRSRLSSLAFSPVVPIAWEGVEFEPGKKSFLQAFFLPAETSTPSMDAGGQRAEGIFQVTVNVPAGGGSGGAEAMADSIIGHFPRGSSMAGVGVDVNVLKAWRSTGLTDGVWYRIPVSIRYWAYL